MSELKFFLNSQGQPCAQGEDARLATYLETDLQGSVALTRELVERLLDAEFSGDFIGNGHCVDFRAESVRIESLYDDEAPDRVLSRSDMLFQVEAWLAFISTHTS